MVVGKTQKIKVDTEAIRQKPPVDRQPYSSGRPKITDSSYKERVDSSHLTSRTVGTRASYPLTPKEIREIEKELEPVARGIKMYENLSDEAKEGMTVKQFTVMNAMLDALRHEEP